jgi:hypothetical protein
VSIPGFTTTVNDCLILDICSHGFDVAGGQFSGLTNASVDGGTVTEELDYGVTAGNGGGVLIASSTKATAGSVSATTATLAVSAATAQIKIALTSIEAGANPAIFFYNRLMSA